MLKKWFLLTSLLLVTGNIFSQEKSIHDLNFLVGTWEVREDNEEKTWWEETIRKGQYTLDSTYLQLESVAKSSKGKERTYRWYIHYNSKAQQFEMISMFSNWHKIQFDILSYDEENRKLTIRNDLESHSDEYHERFGELTFDENFDTYIWKGENKYGDSENPSVWKYIERGSRIP